MAIIFAPFLKESLCEFGKVLCHVVVVFVRVSLVWCVRGVSCVRVCEACELHERSPSAPNFAERTQDETTSSTKNGHFNVQRH